MTRTHDLKSGQGLAAARTSLFEKLRTADVASERVLAAMQRVQRHAMIEPSLAKWAYADRPLPIGHDQTISQPYVVAWMTECAELPESARVLEVGTGSGYQAAVLAEMGAEVFGLEIVPALAERARNVLESLGYGTRVHVRCGDGYGGWPEHAPYDAILVTAATPRIPEPLLSQLSPMGKLVAPVGEDHQQLVTITVDAQGVHTTPSLPVRFVPMTGQVRSEH